MAGKGLTVKVKVMKGAATSVQNTDYEGSTGKSQALQESHRLAGLHLAGMTQANRLQYHGSCCRKRKITPIGMRILTFGASITQEGHTRRPLSCATPEKQQTTKGIED